MKVMKDLNDNEMEAYYGGSIGPSLKDILIDFINKGYTIWI